MTDPTPTPAQQAALDELEAAATELSTYINTLAPSDLIAEARCAFGRLIPNLAEDYGTGHPATVTAVALGECLARFDLRGNLKQDPETLEEVDVNAAGAEERIGYRGQHQPVPFAIAASEDCRCDAEDGGLRKRVMDLHRITHRLMGDHQAPGL